MIILATQNAGKIIELTTLLSEYSCVPQHTLGIEEIEETGLSFVENAILKARHASYHGKAAALADDSGLVVAALKGEPGIYSARYAKKAGREDSNTEYLLECMKGVPDEQRQAYFYCVLVYMTHFDDPAPTIAIGAWNGIIAHEAQGESGFGYDPIFYLPKLNCTVAELSAAEKNNLSHRAQALKQLKEAIHVCQS